jgi:YVTN family beta-propeller protein
MNQGKGCKREQFMKNLQCLVVGITLAMVLSGLLMGIQTNTSSPVFKLGEKGNALSGPHGESYSLGGGQGPLGATGIVKWTLCLANNTLHPGNVGCPSNTMDTSAAVFDSSNGDIYAVNTQFDNVSVISGLTNRIIATVPVGAEPSGLVFDPSNGEIYVTNFRSNNVSVIAGSSNTVIANITVGVDPIAGAFDSWNQNVFIDNQESNTLSVISGSTNQVIATVDYPRSDEYPSAAAFDPDNGNVYVADTGQDNVAVVNGTNNSVALIVLVGDNPDGIVFDPSNGNLYVAVEDIDQVAVFSGSTNSVITDIPVGSLPGIDDIDTQNGDVYVPNYGDNYVSVISPLTDMVITNITVGVEPMSVTFDSQNGLLYVTNHVSGSVSIIGLPTMYRVSFTEIGLPLGTPWGITLNGTGNTSTTNTTAFAEPNGTYPFTVPGVADYTVHPSFGNITIIGAPLNVNITFKKIYLYPVTFTESGLPHGTSWSVDLNGTTHSSTGTNITFDVTNYTYPYSVLTVPGYTPTQSSGNVVVVGLPVFQGVIFAPNPLSSVALTPTSISMDVSGTSPSFNPSIACTGGSCPSGTTYSWNLTRGGLGSLNRSTGSMVSFIAGSVKGTLSLFVNATLNGITLQSAPARITINALPSITSFTIYPNLIAMGGSTDLTVSAMDGTSPYSYAYTGLPSGCGTVNASFDTCVPSACGFFNITVFVIDGTYYSVNATRSLSVVCAITVTSFSVSPNNIDLGMPVTFNTSTSGGLGSYAYAYSGLPAGCATQNTSSLSCTPNATGTFTITVYVNDSMGQSASEPISLRVNHDIMISSFTASPKSVDVGQAVGLSISESGGTSPYTYGYAGLPAGCASSNTAYLICTPIAPGSFAIRAYVNDSVSMSASAILPFTVNPHIFISSFTATPNIVDSGSPSMLSVIAYGGDAPYTYAYIGLPPGCASSDNASISCVPGPIGTYTVRAFVTDAAGNFANSTLLLTVGQDPEVTAFTASANPADVGSPTTMNVSAIRGIRPYAFNYTGLPPGCTSSDTSALVCTPTETGSFAIRVNVNDSDGVSASSKLTLAVNPPLSIYSFGASPHSIDVNTVTILSVAASGGTVPYAYAYTGLPAGCASSDTASINCIPGNAGVYTIRVFVNDSAGVSISTTLLLTVKQAPTPSGFLGLPGDTGYLVIGAIVLAVALAVVIVIMLRNGDPENPKATKTQRPRKSGAEKQHSKAPSK